MNQPNLILKLTVVASSILLAGGFIAYRAGAVNWPRGATEQPADAESSSPLEQNQTILMTGSKYGVIVEPSTPQPATPSSGQPAPIVWSGSKSLFPQVPTSPPDTKTPAAAPASAGPP